MYILDKVIYLCYTVCCGSSICHRYGELMIIDTNNKKSIRSAFGNTLANLGETNKDIVVLDADLACSTQTQIFAKKYPDRFFDCGIAEQDMLATAAGLASEGKIPFAASFAVFVTGRAYDQIRNSICYPNFNVKIIGTHGGITVGEDGATHQALEDVALMRALPNMTVIIPADCTECEQAVKYAAQHKGPVYIRIARSNVPDVFNSDYHFDINKAVIMEQGKDVSIFTNGETLAEVLQAAEILKQNGISAEVINVPVVKPLDIQTIISSAKKTDAVFTVENHSIIGGLGSAICEALSENYPCKVFRIGVNDEFGQSGEAGQLLEHYGLNSVNIAKTISKKLKEMK